MGQIVPFIAFFCALAVILVLAIELRHSGNREARNYQKIYDLMLNDRDEAREESEAFRIAIFPALGRIRPKAAELKPEPISPTSPARPLTHDEQIAAIWRHPRTSTREKLAAVTRLCNTKQQKRDQFREQIENAEALARATVEATETKSAPSQELNQENESHAQTG